MVIYEEETDFFAEPWEDHLIWGLLAGDLVVFPGSASSGERSSGV
jgi:hypothetical protein